MTLAKSCTDTNDKARKETARKKSLSCSQPQKSPQKHVYNVVITSVISVAKLQYRDAEAAINTENTSRDGKTNSLLILEP